MKFHQYVELAFANGSCLNTDKFFQKIKLLKIWHVLTKKYSKHLLKNELFFIL